MERNAQTEDQGKGEQAQELIEPCPLGTPSFLDWLLFLPFIFLFVSVLIVFELVERIAWLFGLSCLERAVSGLNQWVVNALLLLGTRIKLEGGKELSMSKPYIIVCNHQSMFDISIIHRLFREHRPRFVAKKELARNIPAISFCLRHEGAAIIDRGDGKQAIREIRAFGERMKAHSFAAVLFPEGTRARNGKLKVFRTAGFAVLSKTVPEAEIIPVAIDGSWKFSVRKFGPMPTRVSITLKVGTALNRNGKTAEQLVEEAHAAVKRLLIDIRKEAQSGC